MKKETYTRAEVEELLRRILHQDSFGNIHYEANRAAVEYGLNIKKEPKNPCSECGEECTSDMYYAGDTPLCSQQCLTEHDEYNYGDEEE